MSAHIFVVEDEKPILTLLTYNLEKEGYKVSSSSNGEEALSVIKEKKPDLILLDWMLPDLSGIKICQHLKHDKKVKGIPIIMLTAKGEEEDKVKGLESGAEDYLTKPFEPKELLLRMKNLIQKNKYSKQKREIVKFGPYTFNLKKEILKNLVKKLNLENNVHFLGFRDDVMKWMINADIFVTASQVEGSPNSLIEAICLGIPSIATDCPTGPREILNNGELGILVPIDSQKHMTDAIRLLIEDENLRMKFINLSDSAKSRYTSERIVNLYLDGINSMN